MEKINVIGIGYDGKDAVELCTRHNPDYMSLDLSMQKFDGFYALKKLQDTTTKIIVLTGMIDDETFEKLKSFSVFSIQKKPIDIDDFLNILNKK